MIPEVRIHAAAVSVALSLLAPACDTAAPEDPGGIRATTYVDVVSDLAHLQRFPPPGTDSIARRLRADSLRQAILDRYSVTTEDLLGFAERVGLQPDRMETISELIVARTDSLAHARADLTTEPEIEADSTAARDLARVRDPAAVRVPPAGADSPAVADSSAGVPARRRAILDRPPRG